MGHVGGGINLRGISIWNVSKYLDRARVRPDSDGALDRSQWEGRIRKV